VQKLQSRNVQVFLPNLVKATRVFSELPVSINVNYLSLNSMPNILGFGNLFLSPVLLKQVHHVVLNNAKKCAPYVHTGCLLTEFVIPGLLGRIYSLDHNCTLLDKTKQGDHLQR